MNKSLFVFLCLCSLLAACATSLRAQQTLPIAPRIEETPLPPPVELPPPPETPADVPNALLTANEAVRIALRNQPNVAAARAGVGAARGRTQQAQAGLAPSLGFGAGYTHVESIGPERGAAFGGTTGGAGATSASPGYQASATVRQLLFDFNHTRALARQSALLERAAGANLTRVQSDLVFQVKQAFYTYSQNVRLVGVNETNVRNRQDHIALAQARLRAGLGLPSDVVRAETAVAEAILNLTLARNNASVSRVNLALLMGIDPRTPLQTADTGEPAVDTGNLEAMVQAALKQRPEMLQASAALEAARQGVKAARTSNAPGVFGTVGITTRGSQFPPRTQNLSIGASLQWTPLDSGLTAGRVREARSNAESAQAQLNSAQLTVVSDISQAYLNLRTAEQRVMTADSEITNAEESVRLAEGRYRSGIGTFIDILDAQQALLVARTNRVNAQSAVDQARAATNRAVGSPLPAQAANPSPG
ncbi:MAG: TolC family protein [Armatimonadetes bacterium]|nr:TolC family protein [Armatimonadota bacterium]